MQTAINTVMATQHGSTEYQLETRGLLQPAASAPVRRMRSSSGGVVRRV
ncbi:MAG: hypothetical protein HQ567_13905 [Candidatus Nealsonbacteria bacterium]|nr:hypothetical protein [Candidatus Nealsonbacteria bacterium]